MWHPYFRKNKLILKFGLTGDTHNNLKNIAEICRIFNSLRLDFVIHTGDISLPKSLEAFRSLQVPLKGVFGNNDVGDKKDLLKVCEKYNFDFSEFQEIKISKENFIYVIHDPDDIKEDFYKKGNIIVHGHTHRFRDEIVKETHIFNPGECAGLMKGMNKIGIINAEIPKMKIINF